MNTSDEDLEAAIRAAGADRAPRVSNEDIHANIIHSEIVRHTTKSGRIMRWAVLTTRNGFAVTGRPSVAVSSQNDNEGVGVRIAMDNAISELWPLMGYALSERLASE